MAAAALRRRLAADIEITLIEASDVPIIGVGRFSAVASEQHAHGARAVAVGHRLEEHVERRPDALFRRGVGRIPR